MVIKPPKECNPLPYLRVEPWNVKRKYACNQDGHHRTVNKKRPCIGLDDAESDDQKQQGEVKKMREGGQVFRSRSLKRRCEKTFFQRIARQSAQSHEVESRYRISLDEL